MTQGELAEAINKVPATISDYEKGKSLPPLDITMQLCKIFQVSMDDFVNKDLKREDYEPLLLPEERSNPRAANERLLNKLLMMKLKEVSLALKESRPDLYDELELDELIQEVDGE